MIHNMYICMTNMNEVAKHIQLSYTNEPRCLYNYYIYNQEIVCPTLKAIYSVFKAPTTPHTHTQFLLLGSRCWHKYHWLTIYLSHLHLIFHLQFCLIFPSNWANLTKYCFSLNCKQILSYAMNHWVTKWLETPTILWLSTKLK